MNGSRMKDMEKCDDKREILSASWGWRRDALWRFPPRPRPVRISPFRPSPRPTPVRSARDATIDWHQTWCRRHIQSQITMIIMLTIYRGLRCAVAPLFPPPSDDTSTREADAMDMHTHAVTRCGTVARYREFVRRAITRDSEKKRHSVNQSQITVIIMYIILAN